MLIVTNWLCITFNTLRIFNLIECDLLIDVLKSILYWVSKIWVVGVWILHNFLKRCLVNQIKYHEFYQFKVMLFMVLWVIDVLVLFYRYFVLAQKLRTILKINYFSCMVLTLILLIQFTFPIILVWISEFSLFFCSIMIIGYKTVKGIRLNADDLRSIFQGLLANDLLQYDYILTGLLFSLLNI